VTAMGRLVYIDDLGNPVGVRRAKVELCDDDGPLDCELMATSETDDQGNFTVTGRGSDWFDDLPDPYVRVLAASPAALVQTSGLIPATYCFKFPTYNRAPDGLIIWYPGDWSPGEGSACSRIGGTAGEDAAWQQYNNAREAWEFMRGSAAPDLFSGTLANPGRDVPQVRVIWPAAEQAASGYADGVITILPADTWNEAVFMRLYGRHMLAQFVGIPSDDYQNGICDAVPPPTPLFRHCVWHEESGSIHWTEGFPDFLSEVLTVVWGKNDTFSSVFGCDPLTGACGTLETPPQPHPTQFPELTEGYTAAILWDVFDAQPDNHDGNHSQDRLAAGLDVIWDVVVQTRPQTIWEFRNGLAARHPDLTGPVAEIYDENHVIPQLRVTKAGNGQGTVRSTPAGITCGWDCVEPYTVGTVVTLTATPAAGSVFAGWSGGGCSGTGSCTVTLNAPKTITAGFQLKPRWEP